MTTIIKPINWKQQLETILDNYTSPNKVRVTLANKFGFFSPDMKHRIEPEHMQLCQKIKQQMTGKSFDEAQAIISLFSLAEYLLIERHSKELAGDILKVFSQNKLLMPEYCNALLERGRTQIKEQKFITEVKGLLETKCRAALRQTQGSISPESWPQYKAKINNNLKEFQAIESNVKIQPQPHRTALAA